jgi:hypothetical protein
VAGRSDALDRLARRFSIFEPRMPARKASSQPAHPTDAEGVDKLTRGSALRMAATGAIAMGLGLHRAPTAHAQSRDDCILRCYDKYVQAAERDIATCNSFYGGKNVWKGNTGWDRFRRLVDVGGWKFAEDLAREHFRRTCVAKAENVFKKGLDRCDDACEETCGRRMSMRAPTSSGDDSRVCRGTTPPAKSPPPPVPPPPNADNDSCAPCAAVGGLCCGPGPPGKPPCGCAGYFPSDGTDPCKRLGC